MPDEAHFAGVVQEAHMTTAIRQSVLNLQIMSDQPDWCGTCGRRLELTEITEIDGERVLSCYCRDCQCAVLVCEG